MAKKKQDVDRMTWRPTVKDADLISRMKEKLGVSDPDILRMGIRKLAESVLTSHVDR